MAKGQAIRKTCKRHTVRGIASHYCGRSASCCADCRSDCPVLRSEVKQHRHNISIEEAPMRAIASTASKTPFIIFQKLQFAMKEITCIAVCLTPWTGCSLSAGGLWSSRAATRRRAMYNCYRYSSHSHINSTSLSKRSESSLD